MIYLDNAATTFPKPEAVYKAMDEANRQYAVNAGRGAYAVAQKASAIIAETKQKIRKLICADISAAVVFAPSVTVALNQIINGLQWNTGDCIYVSPYEHNAVARTLHHISKNVDVTIEQLPLDDNLEIDISKMKYLFSKQPPTAVFCTHVSNVTGYILPIDEIFEESKRYGCINVLDAAQSLGLVDIDVRSEKDIDIIAFAGHKCLYGPIGIGGFVNLSDLKLQEFIVGGTGSDSLNLNMPVDAEGMFEPASVNIAAVYGLKAALDVLDIEKNYNHEKELTNYLVSKLKELKGIRVFLPQNPSNHIGIVSFVHEDLASDDIGIILDEEFDIAVRTGYHCAPYIHDYLNDKIYRGTVRIGLGIYNTCDDVKDLCSALCDVLAI